MHKLTVLPLLLLAACGRTDLPPIPVNAAPPIRAQFQGAWDYAASHPGNHQAIGNLGMIFAAYEEFPAAAKLFHRARQLQPDEFRWHYYAAVVQPENALEPLTQALRIQPNDSPALLRLGELTRNIETLRRAVAANPQSPLALYALGNSTNELETLNAAVTIAPDFGSAHFALARLHRLAGRNNLAAHHQGLHARYRAIKPKTDDPLVQRLADLDLSAAAQTRRGFHAIDANRYPEALDHFKKALAVNPASDPAHAGTIHVYFKTGRWSEGEAEFQRAVATDRNATLSRLYYARILEALSRKAEALTVLNEAIAINPAFGEAHLLAGLLEEDANPKAAAAHYRKSIEAGSNPRESHYLLGRRLFLDDRHADAIRELEQTIAPVDAKTPTYLRLLASAYLRTGQKAKAAALQQKAAALQGSSDLAAPPNERQ